jgi:hypothetical protein
MSKINIAVNTVCIVGVSITINGGINRQCTKRNIYYIHTDTSASMRLIGFVSVVLYTITICVIPACVLIGIMSDTLVL